MKIAKVLVAVIAISLFAACGSSGGGGSNAGQDALLAAYTTFGSIIDDPTVQACFATNCPTAPCPGGGTATLAAGTGYTLTDCKAADGSTYSGTISPVAGTSQVNGDFPVFGACTNATGTNIETLSAIGCSGSLGGTCAGAAVTATIVADPDGGCTLQF